MRLGRRLARNASMAAHLSARAGPPAAARLVACLVAFSLSVSLAHAQSLGVAAQQAAAQRQAVGTPSRVYTNADLDPAARPSTASISSPGGVDVVKPIIPAPLVPSRFVQTVARALVEGIRHVPL